MKQLLFTITICFLSLQLLGQTTEYWQQTVNYDINVTLNDVDHELDGKISIEYTNNSPNQLDFIYFHLWPNAYKDHTTAFAKQQIENGSTDFFYSKEEERGYIDQLNFKVNDETITWTLDEENIDIAKLNLNTPLKSGETMTISTPFHIKIPESFSRFGHVDQSYQATQWYPKPAVYDQNGWHPMPYLDQGEFYSEYGSFNVKITLPANYVVGATGDLQNEAEIKWLNELAAKTAQKKEFTSDYDAIASDVETKTLHYKQDRVHDFAWFADKRFNVLKSEVALPESGRKVTTWAMFTNTEADLWLKAPEYINDGVYFYSKHVGEYPYNQCTALQSALSAGAGMEYPNVTVIGISSTPESLERVIVHEVGHNWFYGQLGSNERDHAWMDEGINSYYEARYFDEKYPDEKVYSLTGIEKLDNRLNLDESDLSYLAYLTAARKNKDQAIEEKSQNYTNLNYFATVYGKAALAFNYLSQYLGQAKFDKIMKKYYQSYEFKHPQPQDIRRIFNEESGKYLDWFFDEQINTTKKIDYRIAKLKTKAQQIGNTSFDAIIVKNKDGNVRAPYPITAFKDDKAIKTIWYDGFNGEMEVLFPSIDYDRLVIDPEKYLLENKTSNNIYRKKGLFKKGGAIKLQPLLNLEKQNQKQHFFTPALGFNNYDKFMLGLGLYNSLIPRKKLEYSLFPMFSFKNKALVGLGSISYTIYPQNTFQSISFGIGGASFHEGFVRSRVDSIGSSVLNEEPFRWGKIAPRVDFIFKEKSARSKITKRLTLRHINIRKSNLLANKTDTTLLHFTSPSSINTNSYYVNELRFDFYNGRRISPYNLFALIHQGKDFGKLSLGGSYAFNYRNSRKRTKLGFFAGAFLYDNLNQFKDNFKFSLPGINGRKDYTYDQVFFGRNDLSGLNVQQMARFNTGRFKVPVNGRGANEIGTSNQFMAALNLDIDLPVRFLPISVYANVGYYQPETFTITLPDGSTEERTLAGINDNILYEAGVALKIIPNQFEIYFPIGLSPDFSNALDLNAPKYTQRISFMINFPTLNPIRAIRSIEF